VHECRLSQPLDLTGDEPVGGEVHHARPGQAVIGAHGLDGRLGRRLPKHNSIVAASEAAARCRSSIVSMDVIEITTRDDISKITCITAGRLIVNLISMVVRAGYSDRVS
jgi:hypothetical protein